MVSTFRRIAGLLLSPLYQIDKDFFAGKKVILIGPAKTVESELANINLDDYDFIIRMNRSIDLPLPVAKNPRRIDVLFHNFKEHGHRGAGIITRAKVKSCGIKMIVFSRGGERRIGSLFKASFKMLSRGIIHAQLKCLPESFYTDLRNRLGGYSPTTGTLALMYLLNSKVDSLKVIGLTFFQTRYVDGYNDKLLADKDGASWAEERNIHNVQSEALLVYDALKGRCHVSLGQGVVQALQRSCDLKQI